MANRLTAFDVGAVALLTLASRALYFLAGVRFDVTPFPRYIQFIDAELLKDRFVESVWYSHAHPPGLNVLAGAGYLVFGDSAPAFFSLLFHALGFALALGAFALVLRLTGARVAAYVCAAALVVSPGFVLYENWFMYTFLEAALLMVSAVALYETLDRDSTAWAVVLFTALAALVLTRGFFHLGWLVLVAVYVAWAAANRWKILAACAVPLIVAALWYVKNYVYFGAFAASTMFGLGLSNISTLTVTRAELQPLVEAGTLSPLALVSRYENAAVLFSATADAQSGIAVLDRPRKASGEYNYNFRPLVEINDQYARDAFAVMRRFPANYALGVVIANRLFFSPSSMNEYFSAENRAAIAPIERIFNPLVYGVPERPRFIVQPHFGFAEPPSLEVNTSASQIALWLIVLGFGYVRVRPVFVGRPTADRTASIAVAYLLLVMLYVYALGTLVELGENYRYRFVVEPFVFVLATAMATDAIRRLRRVLRRGPP